VEVNLAGLFRVLGRSADALPLAQQASALLPQEPLVQLNRWLLEQDLGGLETAAEGYGALARRSRRPSGAGGRASAVRRCGAGVKQPLHADAHGGAQCAGAEQHRLTEDQAGGSAALSGGAVPLKWSRRRERERPPCR